VIGVLRSSFLSRPGEADMGLSISDGKPPDPGVWSEDELAGRLSKPAAAMVAVAVTEVMLA
jgi:hypothetical protein